jgi:hypothetical protein
LCLHNISDQPQRVKVETTEVFGLFARRVADLITNQRMDDLSSPVLTLTPYQTLWLTLKPEV